MRLLFIRHGDPDYTNDTLTEKGHREAKLLADYLSSFHIDEAYVSPLGRAQDTADYSLAALGIEAETVDWLQEFPGIVDANISKDAREAYKTELSIDESTGLYQTRIMWDMLPSYYCNHPELFEANKWRSSHLLDGSNILKTYDNVIAKFDQLLAEHGYVNNGLAYKVKSSNEKTIAFFCHYGITSVLLSHLWNTSPFVPLQFIALAPTSITEAVSEERQEGITIFRTIRLGDISHLSIGKEEPSFSARFCETYSNKEQRH